MNKILSIPKVLMICFFVNSLCFSQFTKIGSILINADVYSSAFTKVGVENWGAGGAILTDQKISSNIFTNPACIYTDSIFLYAEFGCRTSTRWLNIYESDGQYIIPSFASLTLPCKYFYASFGYANFYDFRNNFNMTPHTVYDPMGKETKSIYEKKFVIHTFFGGGSYKIINKLSIGFACGINYLRYNENYFQFLSESSDYGALFNIGLRFSPLEDLKFGIVYKTNTNIDYNINHQLNINNPDSGLVNTINYLNSDYSKFTAYYPNIFEIGLSISLLSKLTIHGMIEIQNWPNNSRIGENIVNFHFGIEFFVLNSLTVRSGFFTLYDGDITNYGNVLDQNFLTCGFSWKIIPKIKMSVSVLDSHLFNNKDFEDHFGKGGEQFHQTHLSAGISYSL